MKKCKYIVCEKCLKVVDIYNYSRNDLVLYTSSGKFLKDGINYYCEECYEK